MSILGILEDLEDYTNFWDSPVRSDVLRSLLTDSVMSFQRDLESSRVYRRVRQDECDASFTDSTIRSTWLTLATSPSDLTTSVFALPLLPEEVSLCQWFALLVGRVCLGVAFLNAYGGLFPSYLNRATMPLASDATRRCACFVHSWKAL